MDLVRVPNLPPPRNYQAVRQDATYVLVQTTPQTPGITRVDWHGAMVAGPHAGKAPPPWSVGANGFFTVQAQYDGRSASLDLDDEYFRGGDVLLYFWSATDAAGNFATYPEGLESLPASVAAAEAALGGLIEVSYLPSIDWDPAYLERIAAHPSGKLAPTAAELAGSSQRNCILYLQWSYPQYVNYVNYVPRLRRSGAANRTAFMHTLDRLGYAGRYDVYDHQGPFEIYNNQLGGRATVEQASGYALMIYDTGKGNYALPLGFNSREENIPQTQWFQDWLAQGSTSPAANATLWILGENLMQNRSANPLLANEMGVVLASATQTSGSHPNVEGLTRMTWADSTTTDFSADLFNLGAPHVCPSPRNYDGLEASGTAVVTHRYTDGSTPGYGAVVMNANPASGWNTILMSFWWEDVRSQAGATGDPAGRLAANLLDGVLPPSCRATSNPTTDLPVPETLGTLPRLTALHPSVPNPFNPTTTIRFDLSRDGQVNLSIYTVSGRRVRTLVQEPRRRERHRIVWDGLDDSGNQVPSGIYLVRLLTDDADTSRKLVALR